MDLSKQLCLKIMTCDFHIMRHLGIQQQNANKTWPMVPIGNVLWNKIHINSESCQINLQEGIVQQIN